MGFSRREFSLTLLVSGAVTFIYLVFLVLVSGTPSEAQTGGTTTDEDGLDCAEDEELVETFTGDSDETTPEFEITGDEWRYILEATANTETGGTLDVDAYDENGFIRGFNFASVSPDFFPVERRSSGIIDGDPGTFELRIDANGVDYEIIVCEAEDGPGSEPTRIIDPGPEPEPTRIIDPGSGPGPEKTIIGIPEKPLPPTGGLPVYGVVAGLILAGVGLLGLGFGVGRGGPRR